MEVPKLPITATFALPLSIYYIFLQIRVITQRKSTKTPLATTTTSPDANDPLLAAFRTQANFAENVPLVLILAGLTELNGGDQKFLTTALCVFTIGRLMHGEMGLMRKGGRGIGRPVGFLVTMGTTISLSIYGAWCSLPYWRARGQF